MDGEDVECTFASPLIPQTLTPAETECWPVAPTWEATGWNPDLENEEGWSGWTPIEPGMWGSPFLEDEVSRVFNVAAHELQDALPEQ